jgi:hypothetical protein
MMDADARMLVKVPLRVMATSAGYAAALALIERKFRLKPDHEWLEVAVGVGLTLVPVAMEAHSIEQERTTHATENGCDRLGWKTYEGAIWRSFLASGTPVIFWQIGESIARKWELMKYLTPADDRRSGSDANTATQVAHRSGEPAEGGARSINGSDEYSTRSPDES